MLPEIATEMPKASPGSASRGVSTACRDHASPERTKTYAAPLSSFAYCAPTRAVMPEIATAPPKPPGVPWRAVSSACSGQVVPERPNTYTAPLPPFAEGAPMSAVLPEIATARPNQSPGMPLGALSFACRDHALPERTNTYAAPLLRFA